MDVQIFYAIAEFLQGVHAVLYVPLIPVIMLALVFHFMPR